MNLDALDERGVARLVVILVIAVLVLLIPILYSVWKNFQGDVDEGECAIAVQAAQKKLDEEYLTNPGMTLEEAEIAATSGVRSLDDICPGGGRFVVEEREDGDGFKIYCTVHGAPEDDEEKAQQE